MFLEKYLDEETKVEILKSLRLFGIKHLKKLNPTNHVERKIEVYHVFKTPLELLEKELIELPLNKLNAEIPVFIIDSCKFIEQNVLIEGLFRKAGSTCKQRELRALLDCGSRLSTSDDHDVINVANILKLFFRELPEPLIPYQYHDAFLRCLILKEKKIEAILLLCLLIPPNHLFTLAFLMQFLHQVAVNSGVNKMDIGNLAIIFTPSIMPVNTVKLTPHGGERINHHVQVVKILIDNSFHIGIVPDYITTKVRSKHDTSSGSSQSFPSEETRKRRKKKRSSSLNRVLSGLKKIMQKSPQENNSTAVPLSNVHTPRIMSSKKRKPGSTPIHVKKRLEILQTLPNEMPLSSCSFTPIKSTSAPVPSAVKEGRSTENKKTNSVRCQLNLPLQVEEVINVQKNKGGTPEALSEKMDIGVSITSSIDVSFPSFSPDEYVKIPKAEFETIKQRVANIEKRFEDEFDSIVKAVPCSSFPSMNSPTVSKSANVEKLYLETKASSEKLNDDVLSVSSNHRKHYRRSLDNVVSRSPSARRIGSLKRQSKDNDNSTERKKQACSGCSSSYDLRSGHLNNKCSKSNRFSLPSCSDEGFSKELIIGNGVFSDEERYDNHINQLKLNNDTSSQELSEQTTDFKMSLLNRRIDLSECRRDSINEIRNQNYGMVLAKAKLFDKMLSQGAIDPLITSDKCACKMENLTSALRNEAPLNDIINVPVAFNLRPRKSCCDSQEENLLPVDVDKANVLGHNPYCSTMINSARTVNWQQSRSKMPLIKPRLHTPSPKRLVDNRMQRRSKALTPLRSINRAIT